MGNENKNATAAVMAKSPTTTTSARLRDEQPADANQSMRRPEYRTKSSIDLTPHRYPHARKF